MAGERKARGTGDVNGAAHVVVDLNASERRWQRELRSRGSLAKGRPD
jgi:hypothetical protein